MKGWRIVVQVGVVLGFLAEASQSFGQDVRRVEPVTVTATRIEEPLERIGASVSVITGEEIQTRQYKSVEEALRTLPGVEIQRSGSLGKITTLKIRGAGASQVQVLLDGVRVKSTTSGDFDFADLPIDAIERIEVVRGPQSTLYGADAIGGVVNIITKRGSGRPSAFASVEAGNFETFRERVAASGALDPVNFTLGASRLDFGGQFRNDEHSNTYLVGRVGVDLPHRGEVSLVTRYSDAHRGIPFKTVFPNFDPNREQNDTFTLLTGEWRQPWGEIYESQLRLSTVATKLLFRDPPDPGTTGVTSRSEIEVKRREADWLQHFHFAKADTLTVGVEYREEEGRNKDTFSKTTNTKSAFIQNELRLFDRLFLTAGVRYDDNSVFGSEITPRIAASYLLRSTGTRLKASWAEGFRAPTFNDLFFPGFPPCGPFGNPDLRPESSRSWDAGFEQKLWENRLRFGATYFRNDFRDLIQAALVDPVNFCLQAQNVGRARSRGVEAEASLEPTDQLLLTLAYTYTETEDLTTGQPLRRFAPNRWSVAAVWTPFDRLTLTGQVFIVSSQFESAAVGRNPGYTRVDVGGNYRLLSKAGPLESLELQVKIENLLDEDYEEVRGFPALGTYYTVGLRATF